MKGIEIKCALILKGISISELAEKCNVSLTTVSQTIYQNKNYLNKKVCKKISEVLRKPILEIFPNFEKNKIKKHKRIVKTGKLRYPFCEANNTETTIK